MYKVCQHHADAVSEKRELEYGPEKLISIKYRIFQIQCSTGTFYVIAESRKHAINAIAEQLRLKINDVTNIPVSEGMSYGKYRNEVVDLSNE